VGFEVLKARFVEALDREDGSITAAARAVGANRNTAVRRNGFPAPQASSMIKQTVEASLMRLRENPHGRSSPQFVRW
jgi:hypothetical protein